MAITGHQAGEVRRGFRLFPDGVLIVLIAFCLLLLFRDILPARSRRQALEDQIQRLEARSRDLEDECRRTEKFCESLRRDPTTIERVLRREYNLSGENETVLRFENE